MENGLILSNAELINRKAEAFASNVKIVPMVLN
jgi:hypothetical protein